MFVDGILLALPIHLFLLQTWHFFLVPSAFLLVSLPFLVFFISIYFFVPSNCLISLLFISMYFFVPSNCLIPFVHIQMVVESQFPWMRSSKQTTSEASGSECGQWQARDLSTDCPSRKGNLGNLANFIFVWGCLSDFLRNLWIYDDLCLFEVSLLSFFGQTNKRKNTTAMREAMGLTCSCIYIYTCIHINNTYHITYMSIHYPYMCTHILPIPWTAFGSPRLPSQEDDCRAARASHSWKFP